MARSPATVLIADDERALADMYARWLASDYIVRTAYSGAEALETLDDLPDVVLLDRNLPDRSGREILAEIRRRGLPCMVSMVTAVEPGLDVIDLGFDDYLLKPVFASDLHGVVERLLARRELDQELQELFALAAKKAVIESEVAATDLAASQRYLELVEEIRALRSRIDDWVPAFADDYESLFYEFRRRPVEP